MSNVLEQVIGGDEHDTSIVEDEQLSEAAAEKENEELLAKVGNILDGKEPDEKKPDEKNETPGDDEKSVADGDPGSLSQELKDRATEAGFSDDLAARLHEGGLLEESLASFDRKSIESVKSKSGGEAESQAEAGTPPAGEGKESASEDAFEDLPGGEDGFDEEFVKRDKHYRKEIADLKAQVKELSGLAGNLQASRDERFQSWFDEAVTGLKNTELFGKGVLAKGSQHLQNRQSLCDGYEQLCRARGVDPLQGDGETLKRAYSAVFYEEAIKATQQKQVDRLRGAEGKFISKSQPSGSAPRGKKEPTAEERNADLVNKVKKILK